MNGEEGGVSLINFYVSSKRNTGNCFNSYFKVISDWISLLKHVHFKM